MEGQEQIPTPDFSSADPVYGTALESFQPLNNETNHIH
jgi:hypothetical protein